jgi:hypothetical protein
MSNLEMDSDVARQILARAAALGETVEVYLRRIIDSAPAVEEDARLTAMQEAMRDELFLGDLNEVMEDFHHTDLE